MAYGIITKSQWLCELVGNTTCKEGVPAKPTEFWILWNIWYSLPYWPSPVCFKTTTVNQSMCIALDEIKFEQKHFCLSHMNSIHSSYVAILHVLQSYNYMYIYISHIQIQVMLLSEKLLLQFLLDTITSLMILCGICGNGKCDVKFMWLRPTQFVQCAGNVWGHPYRPCVPSTFWIWLCENWCCSRARFCDWWQPRWPPKSLRETCLLFSSLTIACFFLSIHFKSSVSPPVPQKQFYHKLNIWYTSFPLSSS